MGLSSSFAFAGTCTQPSSQYKGKLSKPPAPSLPTPAGRCFVSLLLLPLWHHLPSSVFKHQTFAVSAAHRRPSNQVKFLWLQSEFLDYILIKKFSLTGSSRTAYVKNKEAHFNLLTYNITLVSTAKDRSSGPGDGLKSWVNTQTPQCSFSTRFHEISVPPTLPMQQLHIVSWSQEAGTKAHR